MSRSNPSGLVAKDPKIERIALRNLKARIKERVKVLGLDLKDIQSEKMMEHQRIMSKYARPSLIEMNSNIVRPKIKLNIIRMVQQFV